MESVIAALVAIGFAFAGELVLRRPSRAAWEWSEAFLVGAGLSATLLFPLSLAFPGRGLDLVAALLAAAAAIAVVERLRRSTTPGPTPDGGEPASLSSRFWTAVTVACTILFVALNTRYSFLWDGFQIWATRAQQLAFDGGIAPPGPRERTYLARILEYPPLVPLYEALVGRDGRSFDFDAIKAVFVPFYLAMLVSTHRAASRLGGARVAAAATALLALLPPISAGFSAGGYADMPLAAFVAAAAAAAVNEKGARPAWRSPLPWLLGGCATVKSEGTVLAMVGAVLLLFPRPGRYARGSWRRLAELGLPLLAMLGTRFAYVRWLRIRDLTYGPFDEPHREAALARLAEVAGLCATELFRVDRWGLLWPAFLAAVVILLDRWRPGPESSVAAATLAALAAYSAIFLWTNWSVPIHIANAYPRLLTHLAPAAAVVLVGAYARLTRTVVASGGG